MTEQIKHLSAEAVMAPFVGRDTLTNRELFQQLALQLDIPEAALDARAPVGKAVFYTPMESTYA